MYMYILLWGAIFSYLHNGGCMYSPFYRAGCAVLLCLVCLFDLACFFLSSFSSLI